MCPPDVFENSMERFRVSVGDGIGDVAEETAQTDEGETGALLESAIGPHCFFTNVSIMCASSDSRVVLH